MGLYRIFRLKMLYDTTTIRDLRGYEHEKNCTGAVVYPVGRPAFGMRKESRCQKHNRGEYENILRNDGRDMEV